MPRRKKKRVALPSRQKITRLIRRGASRMTPDDLRGLWRRSRAIARKVRSSTHLRRYADDIALMISLVRNYVTGRYRRIPYWAISAAGFALLYVLTPIDLIADAIPAAGLLDDATVVSVCLLLLGRELEEFAEWRGGTGRQVVRWTGRQGVG